MATEVANPAQVPGAKEDEETAKWTRRKGLKALNLKAPEGRPLTSAHGVSTVLIVLLPAIQSILEFPG